MDKITGLMTGADDYMTKPFQPRGADGGIDALYRRIDSDGSSNQIEPATARFVLNTRNRTLDKDGRRIKLTQVEYAIVKLFMQNPGRALSREDILAAVWGRDYDGETQDRRRQHPPSSHQDRRRYREPDLHHDGLGLRIQMGRLRRSREAPVRRTR